MCSKYGDVAARQRATAVRRAAPAAPPPAARRRRLGVEPPPMAALVSSEMPSFNQYTSTVFVVGMLYV